MAKDLRIAVETARATASAAPLGEACATLWDAAEHALGGGADHTEIVRYLESLQGEKR